MISLYLKMKEDLLQHLKKEVQKKNEMNENDINKNRKNFIEDNMNNFENDLQNNEQIKQMNLNLRIFLKIL